MTFSRAPLDRPLEVFILAVLCLPVGVGFLLGAPKPASIEAQLPHLLITVWAALLVLGSVSALLGIFWRGRVPTGVGLEQAGMIFLAAATFIFAVAVIKTVGRAGIFAALTSFVFTVACLRQVWVAARHQRGVH